MKKKKTTFEKKLKAYSAVAAGTLLLAPSANAAVQYSGLQNISVGPGSPFSIDLNNDGNFDFDVTYSSWQIGYTFTFRFGAGYEIKLAPVTSGSSQIVDLVGAARLPSNYFIGATLAGTVNYWDSDGHELNAHKFSIFSPNYFYTDGNFNNLTGYIGVSFNTACGKAYGWIQYSGDTDFNGGSNRMGSTIQGTVIDWAYEDTCAPILAGDIVGAPPVGVPTLNHWGLFALIALLAGAGVLRLRKQEEV